MLWVIAILLAAILVTLLGAWHFLPPVLAIIVGVILWLALAGTAGYAFGGWGVWSVIAAPFVAVFGYGIVETCRGNVDLWGNQTEESNEKTRERERIDKITKYIASRPDWRDRHK